MSGRHHHGGSAATVAGEPVPVTDVDVLEGRLRTSPQTGALPQHGTSEGRQLRRWLTQLLVTQRVVAREAETLGVAAGPATPTEEQLLPDLVARLEIGSIAAHALTDPLGRAVFTHVTAGVDADDAAVDDYARRNLGRFTQRTELIEHLRGAARRRTFRIWLAERSAELVCLAPGFEHPGDPRQPDNTHRH